ncbi:response regulator transcription factor [Arthrobacter sp. ok362]|uniref:response regulator n=1 Tax=Arthrobacter sp. ok362 TaxID=1761745 RepID=UPI00088B3D66|nr:response regulator transcription factor [Arthrobacter sp. ok362]SDM12513.1 DNA-binding response regulator, NarL/FixJ family, contains REC and HTH domains [Arthrobacter sp. ok362]
MMADPENHQHRPLTGRGVYLLDDHEVVRRGLRQLVESNGLGIAGESGSAREAARRIPALRPDLVILDDDLPDGSGADVCRAIAVAAPGIRCVLMTGDTDEAVLIDSILAGAWGCLSKQDDSSEQLRLIRRALAGHTAYSRLFQQALVDPVPLPGPQRRDERLQALTRQEMRAAIGLGKGLSNRQISQEMFLAEKTIKNLVSSVLMKLGMAGRTEVAVLITRARNHPEDPDDGGYRSSRFPDLIPEVTAALLNCTTEARTVAPTEVVRAEAAGRLADALTAIRTRRMGSRPVPSRA